MKSKSLIERIVGGLITLLGLKGSWSWAVRQMDKGYIVYRTTDTGACKYRFSLDGYKRIQNSFHRDPIDANWKNANIFLSTFEATSYDIWIGDGRCL